MFVNAEVTSKRRHAGSAFLILARAAARVTRLGYGSSVADKARLREASDWEWTGHHAAALLDRAR